MKGFIVTYYDADGDLCSSPLVYRFDSLNELSAKTIALQLLEECCEKITICEVEYRPIYEITHGEPGIGEGCRMVKLTMCSCGRVGCVCQICHPPTDGGGCFHTGPISPRRA